MRMRYERRDPRPEDLRHIEELKNIVESQERDICFLTEQLRELQLTHQQLLQQNLPQQLLQSVQQQQQQQNNNGKRGRNRNKSKLNSNQQQQLQQQQQEQKNLLQQQLQQQQLLKKQQLHKSSCNVIYEENENELEQSSESAENQELKNGESLSENLESKECGENHEEKIEPVAPNVIQNSNESQTIPKSGSSDSIPESQAIPKVESTESVPEHNQKLASDGSIELSDATDFEIVPATVLEVVDQSPAPAQAQPTEKSNLLHENSKKILKDEVITDANVIAVVAAVADNLDLD